MNIKSFVRLSTTILVFGLVVVHNHVFAREEVARATDGLLALPPAPSVDLNKARLGMRLFKDKGLSRDGTVSCESCHNLNTGGVDRLKFSRGIGGARGTINAPTVFNSGFNFHQFWDGRATGLEEQIDGPIENPVEMGANWKDIIVKINSDTQYKEMFNNVYGIPATKDNIKNALATFERSLVTPNSPFDRYLKGETNALNGSAKIGFEKFRSFGCVSCHQGVNVGGNMYQTMGVMGDYFKDRKQPITEADYGRFNVTKREIDKFTFRVPSLRNVALTPPYFHDGSRTTLREAVKIMAKYQLGLELSEKDTRHIVSFLESLTGEKPEILKRLEVPGEGK